MDVETRVTFQASRPTCKVWLKLFCSCGPNRRFFGSVIVQLSHLCTVLDFSVVFRGRSDRPVDPSTQKHTQFHLGRIDHASDWVQGRQLPLLSAEFGLVQFGSVRFGLVWFTIWFLAFLRFAFPPSVFGFFGVLSFLWRDSLSVYLIKIWKLNFHSIFFKPPDKNL